MKTLDLNFLLEEYMDYLSKEKLVAKNTIVAYQNDIVGLLSYLADKDIELVDQEALRGYRRHLLHHAKLKNGKIGYSLSSVARKVSSLKDFFQYLVDIGLTENNPVDKIEAPKIPERRRHYLTEKQAQKIVEHTKLQIEPMKSRDRLMMTMFLTLGLRLDEMTNAKLSNISENSIDIIGKGDKERRLYLNNDTQTALKAYLSVRDSELDHLLLTRTGKPLTRSGIQYTVQKHLKGANIDTDKFSTHSLRHSAATLMHKNGTDIRTIKEVLGHSRIETTMIYTHVDEDQLQQAASSMDGMFS